jgi:hypothetical protein
VALGAALAQPLAALAAPRHRRNRELRCWNLECGSGGSEEEEELSGWLRIWGGKGIYRWGL